MGHTQKNKVKLDFCALITSGVYYLFFRLVPDTYTTHISQRYQTKGEMEENDRRK